MKLKIIEYLFLFIRNVFAVNRSDLAVMRKCLGQKLQNHTFENKTVLKNIFHQISVYMLSCLHASNQDYNKSFDFYWLRDFYAILKI